jgi:hypothetical protein
MQQSVVGLAVDGSRTSLGVLEPSRPDRQPDRAGQTASFGAYVLLLINLSIENEREQSMIDLMIIGSSRCTVRCIRCTIHFTFEWLSGVVLHE